jgi:hypothetical protein
MLDEINYHLGKGIKKVVGLKQNSGEVMFICKDNYVVKMYHEQDCCESVYLDSADSIDNNDDIYTDCNWCIMEIVDNVNRGGKREWTESFTWTFYKMKTNKGYDTLRWYGESNGYYSEKVDLKVYRIEGDY